MDVAAACRRAWNAFRRDRLAVAGAAALLAIATLALAAPLIVRLLNHHPPNQLFTQEALDQRFGTPHGPSASFWFGADPSGRDVFSRVVYGGRVTLALASASTALSVALGGAAGLAAGYFRGWVDTALSALMDLFLAFPIFLLAVGLGVACGSRGCLGGWVRPGAPIVLLVIALASWPYVGRLVRGQVLSLRDEGFVEAARAAGSTDLRILGRHILPNLLGTLATYAVVALPTNILFEAALSFLGVGVQPPRPSWGQMIADSVSTFRSAWWYFLFPGLFLAATVLALNLLGDGVRRSLGPNPRSVRATTERVSATRQTRADSELTIARHDGEGGRGHG